MNSRLSLTAENMPVVSGVGTFAENIEHFSDWSSTIDAVLGFDTASFTLRGSKLYLEEWFANGLGRQITRYAPDGAFMVWQGFVNQMTLVEPGNSSTISLEGIANSVQAKFTCVETSVNPPVVSLAPTLTSAATDADSITQYGTHEEIISVGETTAVLAEQKRDQHLTRLSWPLADDQFDTQQTGDLSLQVSCKGWGHSLAWRIYNQTTNSGTANANTVISDIITAVGDFILSTHLSANATQIPQYLDDDRTALDIMRGIVSVGDASNNRWVMPVLEERALYYKQAASTVEYYRRVSDNRQAVREKSGHILPPWEVRPDRWIRTTDIFPITAGDPASLNRDKQTRYIEKVTWSEPYGLAMFGNQATFSRNLLAKNSLPGYRVV